MRLKPLTFGFVIFVGIFAMMTTIDIQGATLLTDDLVSQRESAIVMRPPHDRLLVSEDIHNANDHIAILNAGPIADPHYEAGLIAELVEHESVGITNQAHAAVASCVVLIPASFNLDYEYLGSPDNPDDCHAGFVDENTGAWVGGFYCDEDADGYYCPFGELIQDTTDYQYYCRIESDC
ncbi:MAG: hypothetical protein OXG05_15215 [Gammaproteobacteria bacterium]|nr:hypothetical protein [Gammaproteobacteria bacterium]